MSLPFANVVLDLGIDYNQLGGVEFVTDIAGTQAGIEVRNVRQPAGRFRAELGARNVTGAELASLEAFFRARRGRAVGFLLQDWGDYEVAGQSLGVGQAGQTTVQLVKEYSDGLVTLVRTIRKPVAATVAVRLDGVTDAGAVDATTGVYTFAAPLVGGEAIVADFEFYVPVRFDADRIRRQFLSFDPVSKESIFYLDSLPVLEDLNP